MEDHDLIAAFEQGLVSGAEFPHERHVRVARGLAQRYGHQDGLRRLIAGLRAILARAGHPEAYHETITRAWYELITSTESLASTPELFDQRLLARYYSSDRLAAGRNRWLEPDLHPLHPPPRSTTAVEPPGVVHEVPTGGAVLATHAHSDVHGVTVRSHTRSHESPP